MIDIEQVRAETRERIAYVLANPRPLDFRRVAEAAQEPYPAPEPMTQVSSYPAPVAAIVRYAEADGWRVYVTRARGALSHSITGRPLTVQESFAVRMARREDRAVAVRHGSTWTSFWTWSPSRFFTRHATLGEFMAEINGDMHALVVGWSDDHELG